MEKVGSVLLCFLTLNACTGEGIAGSDANGLSESGIRIDIEEYIASLDVNTSQREALRYDAKVFQDILDLDLDDQVELLTVGDSTIESSHCLLTVFENANDAALLSTVLESKTYDTPERDRKYAEYNLARSGASIMLPKGDTCRMVNQPYKDLKKQ